MLGVGLRYHEGSRPMGRGVAEHVETNPAASTLVSRRQSPPVAPLLAILIAADQGSNGVGTHPGLRAIQGSSSLLTNGSAVVLYAASNPRSASLYAKDEVTRSNQLDLAALLEQDDQTELARILGGHSIL